MPLLPTAGDGTGAGKEGIHSLCLNIGDVDLFSHPPAKSVQSTLAVFKARPQRLSEGHVLSDKRFQFHSTPPISKSATWRKPARSTLA
jgi:hypothetical protein